MSLEGRLRRREEFPRSSDERLPERPSLAPDVSAILALQRGAGNRALVQRLIHHQQSNVVKVPQSYYDLTVNWDEAKRFQDDDAPSRRVGEIITGGGGREAFFSSGLGKAPAGKVVAVEDAELSKEGAALAAEDAKKGTKEALQRAAVHHYWAVSDLSPGYLYPEPQAVQDEATRVLGPVDYLPSEPDLPPSGVSIRAPREKVVAGGKKDRPPPTWWEFMCVLIALIKMEPDFAKVEAKTKKPVTDDHDAVQKLHDYYRNLEPPVDYDDASVQRRVMTEWGYSLAFTGRAQWAELARVPLAKGRYIFGITGHTVQVDVKEKIEPGKTQITNLDEFFECHSDEENFNKDHFGPQIRVHTIWQKA